MSGYLKNRKGYNLSLWFKDGDSDHLESLFVETRQECNRITKQAENRGCYAWQVTYLSEDFQK